MAKISTLIDSFNDNSMDSGLWGSYGTVDEASNQLEIELPVSTTGYSGYYSTTTYDLTESKVYVEVVDEGNQALSSLQAYPLFLKLDANNEVGFIIEGGDLKSYKKVSSSKTDVDTITYSSTDHKWLQIREASGTLYWEASDDGITFSELASESTPITATALELSLMAGTYSSEGSASECLFDNLNTHSALYDITQEEANARAATFTATSYCDPAGYLMIDDTEEDCFGLVFQGIDTDAIDTLTSATLRLTFSVKQGSDASFRIYIYQENADDSDLFIHATSTGTGSINGKSYAGSYTIRSGYLDSNDYAVDDTVDIDVTTIFNNISGRAGWASGNNMGMKLASQYLSKYMRFYSYDGDSTKTAELILDYEPAVAGEEEESTFIPSVMIF